MVINMYFDKSVKTFFFLKVAINFFPQKKFRKMVRNNLKISIFLGFLKWNFNQKYM